MKLSAVHRAAKEAAAKDKEAQELRLKAEKDREIAEKKRKSKEQKAAADAAVKESQQAQQQAEKEAKQTLEQQGTQPSSALNAQQEVQVQPAAAGDEGLTRAASTHEHRHHQKAASAH